MPKTTSPSKPPKHQPIVHYRRALVVRGQFVHAAVTNLTAAFLEELGDDGAPVIESQ